MEPFSRNNQVDKAAAGWAYRVGQSDLRDVREADGLFRSCQWMSAGRRSYGGARNGDCLGQTRISVPG